MLSESSFQLKKICIIGLGLLGSSLARVFRKELRDVTISAVSRPNTIERGIELGIIDSGSESIEQEVSDADIVIICTPLSTYHSIVTDLVQVIDNHTLITDVGSVKHYVADTINELIPDHLKPNFVPAHPIAGSEKSGVENGDALMFQDKKIYITPTHQSSNEAVYIIEAMWQATGASPHIISAMTHDQIYAKVSHLVQLMISLYDDVLKLSNARYLQKAEGVLLFDQFLRLSRSNPDMWIDILKYNSTYIQEAITLILENLESVSDVIKEQNTLALKKFVINHCKLRGNEVNSSSMNEDADLSLMIIPLMIVSCLLSMTDKEERVYCGSGFNDVTQVAVLYKHLDTLMLGVDNDKLYDSFEIFINELRILQKHIKRGDYHYVYNILSHS